MVGEKIVVTLSVRLLSQVWKPAMDDDVAVSKAPTSLVLRRWRIALIEYGVVETPSEVVSVPSLRLTEALTILLVSLE